MAKYVVPATICGTLSALLIGTAGCAGIDRLVQHPFAPKTVTRDQIVSQIEQKRWDAAGNKPESVSCPEDLEPTVGAKVVCEMTVNGQAYAVDVTVKGIDGDTAELDMQGRRR